MRKLIFFFITVYTVLQANDSITIEDIYVNYVYYPESVYGLRSLQNGIEYAVIEDNTKINKYSYKTGEFVDVLFDKNNYHFECNRIYNYNFNNEENKILIETSNIPQYRHSYFASYTAVNLDNKTSYEIADGEPVQLATWSPKSDKVAYVTGNDLYIENVINGALTAVTSDGKKNEIINGASDWVYEEEFKLWKAFEWSPSGKYLAYYRFDESMVKEFSLTYYRDLYPDQYKFKYPKAGEKNAIVEIWVYNTKTGESVKMNVGNNTDQYIPRINWTSTDNALAIVRLNRLQNKVDVLLASPESGNSETIFTETNPYFVQEITDDYVTFLSNSKEFIIRSEIDGYLHYYRYTIDGELVNQITKGNFDVMELYGIDETNQKVYYRSTEVSPLEHKTFSISFDGTSKKNLSPEEGNHSAAFSSNYLYFIDYYSTTNTPKQVSIKDNTGQTIRKVVDNAELAEKLKQVKYQPKEFMELKTENDISLNGYMIKPANFDLKKKYPLLIFVYGGPDSQEVLNEFSWFWDMWFNYLAQQGYIVACFDNRGTDGRGQEFSKCTYMELGKLESIDQINVVRQLGELSYIDNSRIGIMGWSYGGYMSSLCLFKASDLYKLAIAIAPISNWRFYDTIYTERFMRTPQENPNGYDNNSPINFTEGLKGKFLLIHGMGDDNVHLQNSIELSEKLIRQGKQFDMFYYPNRNHGIGGNNARYHMFTMLSNYIKSNL